MVQPRILKDLHSSQSHIMTPIDIRSLFALAVLRHLVGTLFDWLEISVSEGFGILQICAIALLGITIILAQNNRRKEGAICVYIVYCAATGSSAHGTTIIMARRSVFSILQRAVTLLCWAVPTLPLLQCLLGSLPLHWVGYLPLPHAGPNTVYVPGALRCFALLCFFYICIAVLTNRQVF